MRYISVMVTVWLLSMGVTSKATAQQSTDRVIRVGIIGLDTSHAPAFTKELNATVANEEGPAIRVVAAYPFGSRAIESSASRIPALTKEVEALGVEDRRLDR